MIDEERFSEYKRQVTKELKGIEDNYIPPNNLPGAKLSDWLSWLKNSFVTQRVTIENLRYTLNAFRGHVLSWPETQGRVFTVEDAQQLNVCRICKKEAKPLSDNPLILDYGKEFAHQKCCEKKNLDEDLIMKLQDKIDKCKACNGTKYINLYPCIECYSFVAALEKIKGVDTKIPTD